MKSFERFIDFLDCDSEIQWQNSIINFARSYGFEQALIAISSIRPTSLDQAFLRSNYQTKWLETYSREQLVCIDPTVAHCIARFTPLIWAPEIFSSKKQQEMYEKASGYGLRSGISLPFHGAHGEVGILSFANNNEPSKEFKRDTVQNMVELSMLRDFVFEGSLKFTNITPPEIAPSLTPRETECLKWCAAGKSTWEIAKILRCSEATASFHFANLRQKLKASSRTQILVKAFQCGLLKF